MRWFSKRGLMFCAAFFIALANITLYTLARNHIDTDTTVWANTFVQFEMFAAGILLALTKRRAERYHSVVGVLLVLAGPFLWFVACSYFHVKQPAAYAPHISVASLMCGYALIALGCAAVLKGFCLIGPSRLPRWAASLGKISYGLYVYHQLAILLVGTWLSRLHGLLFLAATFVLSFVLVWGMAIGSYNYLERPFLKLKRRFEFFHSKPI